MLEHRHRSHRAGAGDAAGKLPDQAAIDLVGLLVDRANTLGPGGGSGRRHCRAGAAIRRRIAQRQPAPAAARVDNFHPGRCDPGDPAEPGDGVADPPGALDRGRRDHQRGARIAPDPGRDQRCPARRGPGGGVGRGHAGPARRAEHVAVDQLVVVGAVARRRGQGDPQYRRRRRRRHRAVRLDQGGRRTRCESCADGNGGRGDHPGPAGQDDRPEPKRESLHRA